MKRADIIVGQDYWLDRDIEAPEDRRVTALHMDSTLCWPDHPEATRRTWSFESDTPEAVYHTRPLREKEARTHVVVGGFHVHRRYDGTQDKSHKVFSVTLNQLRGSWQVIHDLVEARDQEKRETQREERLRIERDDMAFEEARQILADAGFESIRKAEKARNAWLPYRSEYYLPLDVIQHLVGAFEAQERTIR